MQDELLEVFMDAANEMGQAPDQATGNGPDGGYSIAGQAAGSQATLIPETKGSSSGSGGSDGLSVATTVLESGLGLVPLVTGLLGLFGGGSSTPTLERYEMPDKLYFEGADTGDDISGSDYDQMGNVRPYSSATAQAASPGAGSAGGSAAPQINVTVQAMDAQSFMDRSNDIAQAVRSAMLNSSSINDVVNEL
jgi:hypothetical protein